MGRPFATTVWAIVCVFIAVCFSLFPGDAPWGGDDAALITAAVRANEQHRLVTAGLGGSFGYPYGPLPTQIYQLLAMVSHDPIMLVRLHAFLFAIFTALGLLWLTRIMCVHPGFAPLLMVGPFFYFYDRLMWDNTFAIPFGVLLLAGYGDFLMRGTRTAFLATVSCAIALPLIHPMTLPLVTAVVASAIFFFVAGGGSAGDDGQNALDAGRSRAFRPRLLWVAVLRKSWVGLVIIAILVGWLNGSYVMRIVDQVRTSAALIPPRGDALTRGQAAMFPLFSGRLFTAYGFFDQRGCEIGWEQNPIVTGARFFTLIAYPLIWLGILAAMARRAVLPLVCVVALVLQSVLDAKLRISPYPHYYSGIWAAIVVLLWMGFTCIRPIGLRWVVGLLYGVSMSVSTVAFAVDVHHQHGGTVWYGPSLARQLHR